jgi:hypothetical protein
MIDVVLEVHEDGSPLEDRVEVARRMLGTCDESLYDAVVVAVTAGGVEFAGPFSETAGTTTALVRDFTGVGALAGDALGRTVVLVDDGGFSAEGLAAMAWALASLRPANIVVITPVATSYIDHLLPTSVPTRLFAERRYVTPSGTAVASPSSAEAATPTRRRSRPARTGVPWTAEEEARILAALKEGQSVREVAAAVERSTSALSWRLERLKLVGQAQAVAALG